MALDLLTFGEALVEIMRTEVGQPLDRPAALMGPYPSGAPFIFAVQAARLGLKVGVIGAVGDDDFGACLRSQLSADQVDLRGLHTAHGYTTGTAFVAYNANGTREFVFHGRHSAAAQLSPDMLTPELFDGLKCLHISGSALSISDGGLALGRKALELAKAGGVKISFDPNIRPQLMPIERAREVFLPFIDAADVLLPTDQELQAFYEVEEVFLPIEALLREYPQKIIVVTHAANGCSVYRSTGEWDFEIPFELLDLGRAVSVLPLGGYEVTEIDPTGAGDCFDAGFLSRWLRGEAPEKAAQFANACGALAVTARGPMSGAMPLSEIERFMQAHQPKDNEYYGYA